MADDTDRSKKKAGRNFLVSAFFGAITIALVKRFAPDMIPFDPFELWTMRGGVLDWLWVALPAFAYGVGVILVAGVVNAVRNMPQIYIDNARMLGASRWRVYTTVVLPAIFPELRATILLSLGIGWAAVLGAEYLGAQSGLGYIIIYAEQFAYLDRMFLVALIFILYASVSYWLFAKLSAKMLQWMPRAGRMTAPG